MKQLSQESFPDMPEMEEDQSDPQEQLVPPVTLPASQWGISKASNSQSSPPLFSTPPQQNLERSSDPGKVPDDEDYDALLDGIDDTEFDGL